MTRYIYSMVRFVPDPATGEFVNLGAIAGSEEMGDWSTRHVQNDRRARSLDPDAPLPAVYDFLNDVNELIDRSDEWTFDAPDEQIEDRSPANELREEWLTELYRRCRNVVQLSPPAPIIASSAEEALDLVFDNLVNDPARGRFRFMTKRAVFGELRRSFLAAGIPSTYIRRHCVLATPRFSTTVDFVIGADNAVQLAHTYSFGIASQSHLAGQVKAWGWTLRELRDTGAEARAEGFDPVSVAPNVPIEVVYAVPQDAGKLSALDEARRVFDELDIRAHELDDADEVAEHARALIGHAT
jgi:hypothetical protein